MNLIELANTDLYFNAAQLEMHFKPEDIEKIKQQEPGASRLRKLKNGKNVTVTYDDRLKRWKIQS